MRKRHLIVSSDEDDDQETLISRTLDPPNPNPNRNSNPNHPQSPYPLEIPDDDGFVDITASTSPPPPPPPIPPSFPAVDHPLCPINEFLSNHGLCLKRQWLDSCISELSASRPGFMFLDVSGKAELCFQQFLLSDMNVSGFGVLPENVHAMHNVELAGPFVLQVDEIVNIGLPLRDRYHDAPAGFKRCLKLSITDGVQRVFGMEYRPIKDLEALAPAGLKVAIRNVHIRHGLLMLIPEVLEVLGGMVEELDSARQHLVHEVNKPPRGKRQRNGEAPPLATRACCAAWPSNTDNDLAQSDVPILHGANRPQSPGQVATVVASCNNFGGRTARDSTAPGRRRDAEFNSLPSNTITDVATLATHGSVTVTGEGAAPEVRPNAEANPSFSDILEEVATSVQPGNDAGRAREGFSALRNKPSPESNSSLTNNAEGVATSAPSGVDLGQRTNVGFASHNSMLNAEGNPSFLKTPSDVGTLAKSGSNAGRRGTEGLVASNNMPDAETSPSSDGALNVATLTSSTSHAVGSRNGYATSSRRSASEAKPSSNTSLDVEETHKANTMGHLLILSEDKEIPFTYLACLLAKWAVKKDIVPFVHGKIKCFLTGVKEFQFKNRSTYMLRVYVDDGSLISEVLIDHNVVQKGIGYSPEEVTAALSSADKKIVSNMRETMKKYQIYLAYFEGTMLVEMSGHSPLPVALDMDQGCPSSDAWLLLRRSRVFTAPQSGHQHQMSPIDISP